MECQNRKKMLPFINLQRNVGKYFNHSIYHHNNKLIIPKLRTKNLLIQINKVQLFDSSGLRLNSLGFGRATLSELWLPYHWYAEVGIVKLYLYP